MKLSVFLLLVVLSLASLLLLNFSKKEKEAFGHKVIYTSKAPKPIGPYSQAILTGNTLYVSGQIAIHPETGSLDTTSIEAETKLVMQNISAVLEQAKMNTAHIVKTTIYLTDLADFKKVNELYATFFKENPPARETVQVAALPKGAHIEISVTAVK